MPLVIDHANVKCGMQKEWECVSAQLQHCILYSIVYIVMCIFAICKCLSWGGDQQQDLGKPSLKIAKPSHPWEVVGHPISRGEWKFSVCFERGAKMDSFAAVLITLSCSSMYEIIRVKKLILCLMRNDYNDLWVYVQLIAFFIRRLKINLKTHLGICICSWDRHRHEQVRRGPLILMEPRTKVVHNWSGCMWFAWSFLLGLEY
jgi:hypothetical protein